MLGNLLLVLLAWAQVATASGTSSIRGRVTAHETGKPITRVVLKLGLLGPPGTQRTTTTDANGRYEFTGLVGGTYRLTANPQENEGIYLSGQFGAPVSFDPANGSLRPSLELHDGQTFTADISLPNAMSIAGHVLDERGEPMRRMRVLAMHAAIPTLGVKALWTDGAGEYRLMGLRPGLYRVCVDPTLTPLTPSRQPPPDEGHWKTCYPAATRESEGKTVDVTAADVSGIDIHVRRGQMYSVSGVAFDSAGAPLANGSVALGRLSADATILSPVSLADGQFTVRGLQPGEYLIRAEVGSSSGPSAYEMGLVSVTIDRANLTGVVVRTAKAVAVSGRVEFLEGAPPRKPIININTRLANGAATAITGRFLPPARMQQDLSFRLDGLLGPRALQVFGSMRPWVVKAIQYKGRDIFGEFVDFSSTGDVTDVVVMLTNRGASVSGRVQIDGSVNSEDLAVVLIPRQSTSAKALLPGAIVTSPVVDGQYQLPLVRAGDYLVAAIALSDVPPAGAVTMPGAFDRLGRVAQPIQLGERQDLRLDLKVVRPGSN